jgi:hypothetical protein
MWPLLGVWKGESVGEMYRCWDGPAGLGMSGSSLMGVMGGGGVREGEEGDIGLGRSGDEGAK